LWHNHLSLFREMPLATSPVLCRGVTSLLRGHHQFRGAAITIQPASRVAVWRARQSRAGQSNASWVAFWPSEGSPLASCSRVVRAGRHSRKKPWFLARQAALRSHHPRSLPSHPSRKKIKTSSRPESSGNGAFRARNAHCLTWGFHASSRRPIRSARPPPRCRSTHPNFREKRKCHKKVAPSLEKYFPGR
jgi:hypothetical protein